ncbi:MAG TPA: C1 family peptidase [Burkholderiales bacterium]
MATSSKTRSSAKTRSAKAKPRAKPLRNTVKIDPIDLRDRRYMPPVHARPPAMLRPNRSIAVLNQKLTNACTGFALASVVHWLQATNGARYERVSPFMIYSMARRYDEFRGAISDTGSSLRGALKGWYRHGICRESLWRTFDMPGVPDDVRNDWWADAMRRPLGAYYRVDTQAISDMHVALNDVGVLYASAACHAGWDEGYNVDTPTGEYWEIPQRKIAPNDGGHAFAILGYTRDGFIIQNSWGDEWGVGGRALLRYEDWRENAMDCWVVQIGVATSLHLAISQSASLRLVGDKVELAQEKRMRNHELAPYIVNMENNGKLSESGDFRTKYGDVEALVSTYLERAREQWGLGKDQPVDIAIYAHGGLTTEKDAATTAAQWVPALYEQQIFPIFFMWETGLLSTLSNIVKDLFAEEPKRVAGIQRWWDERLERTLARPGTAIWGEMKENGALIGGAPNGGGHVLYDCAMRSNAFKHTRDRIHLIGHSAGGIVHSYLVDMLAKQRWRFSSVNLMAPAATRALFDEKMLPHIKAQRVAQYNQWHLSDPLEEKDNTCRPILGYGRSLLYLVSESFEGGVRTPILGMQKYVDGFAKLPNVKVFAAQSRETNSTTHGGFDNDVATMQSVIRQIKATREQ